MREKLDTLLIVLGSSAVTVLMLVGVFALADGSGTTPTVPVVVPYHGHLEKNGKPVNGLINMHFYLYNGPDASEAVWNKKQQVQVYAGEFTALIGGDDDFQKAISGARDLYLGVAIVRDDGTENMLSNRQHLLAVPYAVGLAPGRNVDVVAGHYLQINGSDLRLGFNDGLTACRDDGEHACRAMVHNSINIKDTSNHSKSRAALILNYDGDFDGGVEINDSNAWHTDANSSSLTVYGKDSDGEHSAPLAVISNNQTMFVDGNEIDTPGHTLYLQSNVGGKVNIGSTNNNADLTVMGSASINGDLTLKGNLKVDTDNYPLVKFSKYYMGTDTYHGTNYSASKWFCTIAGVKFGAGDIDQGHPDINIMYVYTYVNSSNNWAIRMDFKSNGHHESHTVGLMCIRKSLCKQTGTWFSYKE